MGHIYIKDIQFAAESKIEDGILYVNKEAVEAVALEDEHIKSVSFDIARPGESVRIDVYKRQVVNRQIQKILQLHLKKKKKEIHLR